MKGKIIKRARNVGSHQTPTQAKNAQASSRGTERRVTTKATPSKEGYQYAPRADITSRETGYMSKNVQSARYNKGQSVNMGAAHSPAIMGIVGENFSRVSRIGVSYSGSAKILRDRTGLNRI
jgi:hypothetical protein